MGKWENYKLYGFDVVATNKKYGQHTIPIYSKRNNLSMKSAKKYVAQTPFGAAGFKIIKIQSKQNGTPFVNI